MAMLPHKFQPKCAAIIAQAYVCCGMGVDDDNVHGLVNFNAFYTSHYTWAYVHQLLSIVTRMVSITWLLASIDGFYSGIVLVWLIVSRLVWIFLFDKSALLRPLITNFINSLSLIISDSAWAHQIKRRTREDRTEERFKRERLSQEGFDEQIEDDMETNLMHFVGLAYDTRWLQIMILTTIENVAFLYLSAFQLSKNTKISYYDASCLFASMCVLMFTRWIFIIHWVLPVHFHSRDAIESAIEEILTKQMESSMKLKRQVSFSPRRRNLVDERDIGQRRSRTKSEDSSSQAGRRSPSANGNVIPNFLSLGTYFTDDLDSSSPVSIKADIELGGIDVNLKEA
jgi:hypothetical protein